MNLASPGLKARHSAPLHVGGPGPSDDAKLFGVRDVGPHRENVLDVMPGALPFNKADLSTHP
jgi:hypothetical protein